MRWTGIVLLLAAQGIYAQTARDWDAEARRAVTIGNWQHVLEIAGEQWRSHPQDRVAEWLAGHSAIINGDYRTATEVFGRAQQPGQASQLREWAESLLAGHGESAGGLLLLGDALARENRGAEALGRMNRAVEIAPKWAAAFNARGAIHVLTGNLERADSDFATAVALEPSLADAHANRGLVLLAQGQPKQAIDSLTLAVDRNSDHAMARYARGIAYAQLADWTSSAKDLQSSQQELASLAWARSNQDKVAQMRQSTARPSGVMSTQTVDLTRQRFEATSRVLESTAKAFDWVKPVAALSRGTEWGNFGLQTGLKLQQAYYHDLANPTAPTELGGEIFRAGAKAAGMMWHITDGAKRTYFDPRGMWDSSGGQAYFNWSLAKPQFADGPQRYWNTFEVTPKVVRGMTALAAAEGLPEMFRSARMLVANQGTRLEQAEMLSKGLTKSAASLMGKVAGVGASTMTFGLTVPVIGPAAVPLSRVVGAAADVAVSKGIVGGTDWAKKASLPLFVAYRSPETHAAMIDQYSRYSQSEALHGRFAMDIETFYGEKALADTGFSYLEVLRLDNQRVLPRASHSPFDSPLRPGVGGQNHQNLSMMDRSRESPGLSGAPQTSVQTRTISESYRVRTNAGVTTITPLDRSPAATPDRPSTQLPSAPSSRALPKLQLPPMRVETGRCGQGSNPPCARPPSVTTSAFGCPNGGPPPCSRGSGIAPSLGSRCPDGSMPPCRTGGATVSMPKTSAYSHNPPVGVRPALPGFDSRMTTGIKPGGVLLGAQVVEGTSLDFSGIAGTEPAPDAAVDELVTFYIPTLLYSGLDSGR